MLSIAITGCATAEDDHPFAVTAITEFNEPWAMEFLPDGRLLVAEQGGRLLVVTQEGDAAEISGVPDVDYGGQGGFGSLDNDGGELADIEVVWRQVPKVTGRGHYGHRLVFSPDGYLFISSGERQKFDPAQDMQSNLGKIIRLHPDGSVPDDNPFADQGGVTAQIWSLGHRNPLGIAFDANGQLWNTEMGPRGGDELNLVLRGENYGYPLVSNGRHYSFKDIPDHDTRPEFKAPKVWWTPVISPGGLMIYSGQLFADWNANGFIPGLSSQSLVRIEFDGADAREAERFDMGKRIRAVEQGPNGAIWLLEDERGGRLLKLTPL
jgi:glucose/arabinose dehydrogenase